MTNEQLMSAAENFINIYETFERIGIEQDSESQCQYELNKYALKKLKEDKQC